MIVLYFVGIGLAKLVENNADHPARLVYAITLRHISSFRIDAAAAVLASEDRRHVVAIHHSCHADLSARFRLSKQKTERAAPWRAQRRGQRLSRLSAWVAAARTPCPAKAPSTPRSCSSARRPGYYEDQQGRPFVGAAGQFLEELLGSIGLKRTRRLHRQRDQVPPARATATRCRRRSAPARSWLDAPDRDHPAEADRHAGPLLDGALLPRHSRSAASTARPARSTARWVVPMYHPAAALHQGSLRRTIEDDFRKIPATWSRPGASTTPRQERAAAGAARRSAAQM